MTVYYTQQEVDRIVKQMLAEMSPPPLMTLRDVMARLNVSEPTVRRMVRRGDIPAFRVGGQLRFERKEIEKWLKDHPRPPSPIAGGGK